MVLSLKELEYLKPMNPHKVLLKLGAGIMLSQQKLRAVLRATFGKLRAHVISLNIWNEISPFCGGIQLSIYIVHHIAD